MTTINRHRRGLGLAAGFAPPNRALLAVYGVNQCLFRAFMDAHAGGFKRMADLSAEMMRFAGHRLKAECAMINRISYTSGTADPIALWSEFFETALR